MDTRRALVRFRHGEKLVLTVYGAEKRYTGRVPYGVKPLGTATTGCPVMLVNGLIDRNVGEGLGVWQLSPPPPHLRQRRDRRMMPRRAPPPAQRARGVDGGRAGPRQRPDMPGSIKLRRYDMPSPRSPSPFVVLDGVFPRAPDDLPRLPRR